MNEFKRIGGTFAETFTVIWCDLGNGQEAQPFETGADHIVSIQVCAIDGRFGKCRVMASNDGSHYSPLIDGIGNEIELLSDAMLCLPIDVAWIVPVVTGDNDPSVTVILRGRKQGRR